MSSVNKKHNAPYNCAGDDELKEAFRILRPLCVEVVQDGTGKSLTQLKESLLSADELALNELQEYVLFALRIAFRKSADKAENYKIALYECTTALSSHIEIGSLNVFIEFINYIVLGITLPFPDTETVTTKSHNMICEEIKLNAVLALDSFFQSASEHVLNTFYSSVDNLPFLGNAVFIILGYIENEKYGRLRMSSVNCLMRLARCHLQEPQQCKFFENYNSYEIKQMTSHNQSITDIDCPDNLSRDTPSNNSNGHCKPPATSNTFKSCHKELKNLDVVVGNVFASFLPRISVTLTSASLADSKQGQRITSLIIAAFASIIEKTFSDEQIQKPQTFHVADDSKFKKLLIDKSKEWVEDTGDKLGILIGRMVSLLSEEGWRIRYELVNMADLLLDKCTKSLKKSFNKLFNVIICSLVDVQPAIQNQSEFIIDKLKVRLQTGSGQCLGDLVEDNFFQLVEDLPALLLHTNDSKRLSTLNLLSGHLKLLNTRAATLFQSDDHMDLLFKSFFNMLEFDCCSSIICCDHPDYQFSMNLKCNRPKMIEYSFKKFNNDLILSQSRSIFNMIGQNCDLHIIIDKLLSIIISSNVYRKQAVFCLVEILNGLSSVRLREYTSYNYFTEEGQGCMYNERYNWLDVEDMIDMIIGQALDKSLWTDLCEGIVMDTLLQPMSSSSSPYHQLSSPCQRSSLSSSLLISKQDAYEVNSHKLQGVYNHNQVYMSPKDIKEEITFSCLLLDVLGAASMVMGKQFECSLSKVLLPVLERIGSSRQEIRIRAFNALYNMAKATSNKCSTKVVGPNEYACNINNNHVNNINNNTNNVNSNISCKVEKLPCSTTCYNVDDISINNINNINNNHTNDNLSDCHNNKIESDYKPEMVTCDDDNNNNNDDDDDDDDDDYIVEMIIRCSDYIMSCSMTQLKSISRNPGILTALRVVVQLGTPSSSYLSSSSPSLSRSSSSSQSSSHTSSHTSSSSSQVLKVVNSAFKQIMDSLDNHYLNYALQYLKLLLHIAKLVAVVARDQQQYQQQYQQQKQHQQQQQQQYQQQQQHQQQHQQQQQQHKYQQHHQQQQHNSNKQHEEICKQQQSQEILQESTTNSTETSSPTTTPSTSTPIVSTTTTTTMSSSITTPSTSTTLSTTTTNAADQQHTNLSHSITNATQPPLQWTDRLKDFVMKLEEEARMNVVHDEELDSMLKNNSNDETNVVDDDDGGGGHDDVGDGHDDKVTPPYYIQMLEQILERCQHYLTFPCVHVRLVTLEIVEVVCPVMKMYQDVLLPLVHKIWKPFVNRFKDQEHYISIRAFEVLKVISESTGDFVRRRMVNEVMPKVIELLKSLAKNSLKQSTSYRYTTACKLQKCILRNLGSMSRHADIQGQSLMNIIHPCMMYLCNKQPPVLQEACMETMQEFVQIDSDMVWLALYQAYPPCCKLVPPSITSSRSSLKLCTPTYELKRGDVQMSQYTSNVLKLHEICSI